MNAILFGDKYLLKEEQRTTNRNDNILHIEIGSGLLEGKEYREQDRKWMFTHMIAVEEDEYLWRKLKDTSREELITLVHNDVSMIYEVYFNFLEEKERMVEEPQWVYEKDILECQDCEFDEIEFKLQHYHAKNEYLEEFLDKSKRLEIPVNYFSEMMETIGKDMIKKQWELTEL